MSSQRESVTVLEECIELQKRKSQDYQNPNSNIVQAMHYRRGVSTIHDMVHQKLLRAQSLLEPLESGDQSEPNFESLEDTYKDAINYLSFAVAYIRGRMEGQDADRDMLNRRTLEDTSGGSSSGQVVWSDEIEEDGFTTVYSSPPIDEKYTCPEAAELAAVKTAYISTVAPIGRIVVPDEPPSDTIRDSITETYERVRDVGDRMDEDVAQLNKG